MDISLKDLMSCEGVDFSDDRSVLFRLFGFIRGQVPPDPDTSETASVSVRQLANDLEGDHIHLNVIRVGFDALSATGLTDGLIELDYSVYRIRNIYRTRGIGVGRTLHWFIDSDESDGLDTIGSADDARDLWRSWSVDNNGIDAFVVRSISGFFGLSPVGGDCDKGGKNDGCLAAGVDRGDEGVSRTFAHEVGHFLGLEHNHGDNTCPATNAGRRNLMAQTGCVPFLADGSTRDTRDSVRLTTGQGNIMDDGECIRGGC
jgi:hypothetical protein